MSDARMRFLRVFDERIARHLPGTSAMRLRIFLLRMAGAEVGRNVVLAQDVRVIGADRLVIQDNASVARGTVLDARGGLTIERGALIGFESIILTSTHNSEMMDTPVHNQGMFTKAVVVGANSWIGTRCVIQPGVSIGHNVVLGSSAVVTKSLAADAVYAGVPARFIRHR